MVRNFIENEFQPVWDPFRFDRLKGFSDLEKLQLAETPEVSLGKQRSVTRDHHVSCTSKRTVID